MVTGTVPDALISIFLTPPAPPPPAPLEDDPPPPAITKLDTTLVPDNKDIHPDDVLVVTLHFPKEVKFLLPIIPPFDLAI
jgi:hypothetical protein